MSAIRLLTFQLHLTMTITTVWHYVCDKMIMMIFIVYNIYNGSVFVSQNAKCDDTMSRVLKDKKGMTEI